MSQVRTREEIENKYKWNLKDIFESVEKWEDAFNFIKSQIPELCAFKGKRTGSVMKRIHKCMVSEITGTEAKTVIAFILKHFLNTVYIGG